MEPPRFGLPPDRVQPVVPSQYDVHKLLPKPGLDLTNNKFLTRKPKLLNMPPTGHVDIAPPDYSIYQQELRAVFGEYLTAIQCFRECKVLSYAYRDYIMFRVVLEAVCHLGIPPNRHGQSFRIGSFNLKNGSVKGVTIAQFVDDLGLSWGTWSSKSSLFFNIEDLLQICSKSQDEGRVMVYDVRKLQGDLQVWSDASLPLLDEPSVKRVQSSRKLQEKLKHILRDRSANSLREELYES